MGETKQESTTPLEVSTREAPQKRAYRKPELRRYGTLRQLTQSGGTNSAEGGSGKPHSTISDRAVKQSIVRIGTHPLGFGLYLFDYRPEYRDQWGHGRQFGVIADEVETVVPGAVSRVRGGLRAVDYGMLGIGLATR